VHVEVYALAEWIPYSSVCFLILSHLYSLVVRVRVVLRIYVYIIPVFLSLETDRSISSLRYSYLNVAIL
jgi:hypothetical protein